MILRDVEVIVERTYVGRKTLILDNKPHVRILTVRCSEHR